MIDERVKTNILSVILFLFILVSLVTMIIFSRWVNKNGNEESNSSEPYVSNLDYALSDDEKYYSVTGPGSFTCVGIVINNTYKGLPVKTVGGTAFAFCEFLKRIYLPDSITEIGTGAFTYCTSLEYIEIPDGVTVLSEETFWGCKSLESISINPITLLEIGRGAFEMCESLSKVYMRCSIDDFSGYPEESIGNLNTEFERAAWYYYSEEIPTSEGNFWHYVNGVPTPWTTNKE